MINDFRHTVNELKRKNKKEYNWRKVVALFVCMVVFCTTHVLIFPEITFSAENKPVCTEETASELEENIIIAEESQTEMQQQEKEETQVSEKQQNENTEEVKEPTEDTQKNEQPAEGAEKPGQPTEDAEKSEQPAEDTEKNNQETEEKKDESAEETKQSPEMKQDEQTDAGNDISQNDLHTIAKEGKDYTVHVTFTDKAELPADVELLVDEVEQGSEAYSEYYKKAEESLEEDQELVFCRFFDVSFISNGEKIEPKDTVDVEISYTEEVPQEEGVSNRAIHFAEDGIEVIPAEVQQNQDGEDTFSFSQDSFSVTGTAVTAVKEAESSPVPDNVNLKVNNSSVTTYAPDTADISILKVNNQTEVLTGAVFSLETQDGTGWKSVDADISVDSNGNADVKDLQYDQPYRLTETKAPDGYSMLTDPVCFKIQKVNGEAGLIPCDADGSESQTWQEQVEINAEKPLQLKIINKKKAVLPDTGGSGTTWIYIMGTTFVFAGAILYGCRKKQGRRNKQL